MLSAWSVQVPLGQIPTLMNARRMHLEIGKKEQHSEGGEKLARCYFM